MLRGSPLFFAIGPELPRHFGVVLKRRQKGSRPFFERLFVERLREGEPMGNPTVGVSANMFVGDIWVLCGRPPNCFLSPLVSLHTHMKNQET